MFKAWLIISICLYIAVISYLTVKSQDEKFKAAPGQLSNTINNHIAFCLSILINLLLFIKKNYNLILFLNILFSEIKY